MVVVEVGGYLPLVGFLYDIGAIPLRMARGKLVALCACIAKVRALCEIGFRKANVGFVGGFVGKAEFKFKEVVYALVVVGLCRNLGYEVVALKARAVVWLVTTKAFRLVTQVFYHITHVLVAVAKACIRFQSVVTAIRNLRLAPQSLGNGRRNHVDGTTRCERTVLHLTATFKHFDGIHASGVGEIVGCRRGVWGRCSQHTVFHERDTFATFGLRTAQTDVGAKSKAVFLVHVNTRDALQHTVNVGVTKLSQFGGR